MPAISAVDAITPAIQRTKTFLFRPFRWSTFLKLSLVALITEGFGGRFNFSMPGGHSSIPAHSIHSPFVFSPELVAAIAAGTLVLIVVGFIVAYLITRLRFAYFHCLIHNTTEIRPGWTLYRSQATRFFWMNIAVGLCFLLLVALIALPFIAGFWRLFHGTPDGGHPDFGTLLTLVLPLIPVILLLVLAGVLTDLVLRDLMLPHYALENATAGEAWAAVWARVSAEKGPFFVYALLRVILPFVAAIAVFLALIIPGIIVIAVFAVIELGIHSVLAGAAGIVLQVLVGALAFCILFFAGLCIGGPLSTAVREYALLFYGTRYPRLGEILFPPPDLLAHPQGTV